MWARIKSACLLRKNNLFSVNCKVCLHKKENMLSSSSLKSKMAFINHSDEEQEEEEQEEDEDMLLACILVSEYLD